MGNLRRSWVDYQCNMREWIKDNPIWWATLSCGIPFHIIIALDPNKWSKFRNTMQFIVSFKIHSKFIQLKQSWKIKLAVIDLIYFSLSVFFSCLFSMILNFQSKMMNFLSFSQVVFPINKILTIHRSQICFLFFCFFPLSSNFQ